MALYHPPEDPNKPVFAGGTVGQALAKHRLLREQQQKESGKKSEDGKEKKSNLGDHLHKASEHIEAARKLHAPGMLSEAKEKDPHEIDEEAGGSASLMELAEG
jgi:hypothetical protein